MVKVYEVDTQYINQNIAKGKTIMKFVTLQDYEQQSKETEKKIKEIAKFLEECKEVTDMLNEDVSKDFCDGMNFGRSAALGELKEKFPELFKESDK